MLEIIRKFKDVFTLHKVVTVKYELIKLFAFLLQTILLLNSFSLIKLYFKRKYHNTIIRYLFKKSCLFDLYSN